MKSRLTAFLVLLLASLLPPPLAAQDQPKPHADKTLAAPAGDPAQEKEKGKDEKPKWDVSAPAYAYDTTIPLDVNEGTWMSVDVSPDGQEIVFDLLGDLYTMPISGARRNRSPPALPGTCSRATRPTASGSRSRPTARAATTSGPSAATARTRSRSRRSRSAFPTHRPGRPTRNTSRRASTSPARAPWAPAKSGSTTARGARASR